MCHKLTKHIKQKRKHKICIKHENPKQDIMNQTDVKHTKSIMKKQNEAFQTKTRHTKLKLLM